MRKVLMLATTAAMIEQFNRKNIELLNTMGYCVDVAGNFQQGNPISNEKIMQFQNWIEERGGCYYDIPMLRKPSAVRQNLKAYKLILTLLNKNHYLFIHVHTPIGAILGRIAAHMLKIPVIYTAHGFHFFKGVSLKNWILFYPLEWMCSWWTDILITINTEDYKLAKNHMHAKRIQYVKGVGIDFNQIEKITVNRTDKLSSLHIPEEAVIILSVGELNKNKNHEVVLHAMSEIQNEKVHYVICGQGEEKANLEKLAEQYGIHQRVHILGFRNDILELYKCSDIFAFPSKREGLSVALMEAMAAGLPVICFQIRGNVDLIEENRGGYLAEPNNQIDFKIGLDKLCMSKKLRKEMGSYNKNKAREYDVSEIDIQMRHIYNLMFQNTEK